MSDTHQLPPLILHPFSGGSGTDALLEGSLASLALEGLMTAARAGSTRSGSTRIDASDDERKLLNRVLAGRYQEIRMLLFLGKDIFRWLLQCVDSVHSPGAASDGSVRESDSRIVEQSFSALLVDEPPEGVRQKLETWGVTDRRAIFSRAIGIHSLFEEPPPFASLSPIFLKNYHRYADHAYVCYQHSKPFLSLEGSEWPFELYASEEYARILSEGWNLG